MADLISRQAAIDGLDGHRVERRCLNDWQFGWNEALEWVQVSYLEDFPSAQPEVRTQMSVPDCISRQAAIDALGDEPEVWTGRDEYAQGLNNQWHYDRNAIKAVPSAEPEIIRCKDCAKRKYCRTSTVWAVEPGDDWFCADADRREDV